MDPLSIVTAVISIIAAVTQSSKALFKLIEGVTEAPQEILSIAIDLHGLNSIVLSLRAILQEENIRDAIWGDESTLMIIKTWNILLGTVKHC